MLESDPLNVLGVTQFNERLQEAMQLSGRQAKEVAAVLVGGDGTLGATDQAVYAALKGTTKSITAENVARAARFMGVDMFWLATGVGSPREKTPLTLDPDQQYILEKMQKLSRYHLDMLIVAVDAFSGPFADRATMSIAYGPRASQPTPAPAHGQETPGD